jgi:diguanylate cyclase (GGDEF)-like protein/PAS domain S-box-containing protein
VRHQPATSYGLVPLQLANKTLIWGRIKQQADEYLTVLEVDDCTAIANAINSLSYQESTWRNAVESADHGVWDYNAIGDTRYFSDGWKRLRGIPEGAQPYNTYGEWIARIHPEDREYVEEQIRLHNSGEQKQFRFEYRERDYNGNYIWILSCGRSIEFDSEGIPTRLLGVDVNITAIKEEEIKRRQELMRIHTEHVRTVELEHLKTEAARQEAHSLSRQDPLTLLANRRVFADEISRLLKAAGGPRCFAVLLIDLDRFKPVNDLYGHATGDAIIRLSAERLALLLDSAVTVARLGGDEFGVIIEGSPDELKPMAEACARKVVEVLSEPMSVNGFQIEIGASVGISMCPLHGTDGKQLFRNADMALYDVKQIERGRYKFYSDSMGRDAQARASMEAAVRQAVINDEFTPHFQPIVAVKTGRIAGFEILARWHSKSLGQISPDRFISIIDQFNLMPQFTLSMLRQGCEAASLWPEHIHISLNLSAREVCDIATPLRIFDVLHKMAIQPRRLKIEITEQALMQDIFAAKQVVAAFRAAGVKVHLDDFGAGYAGLGYLRDLKFDSIKIDRTFVTNLVRQVESAKIVSIIHTLANSLELETIAEGIEDEQTFDAVRRIGCEYGQGYYFSPAVPASDTPFLLSQSDPVLRKQA